MNAVRIYLESRDQRVSGRLAEWNPPRWFRAWMLTATRLGDGWLWGAIAMILLALGEYGVFAAAGLACCSSNIAMIVLKKRFRRMRPCSNGVNHFFQMIKADLSAFDCFSFPSGHTMNAFAIGTVLSANHPVLLPYMTFVATSVAASRLILRLHFLTDVLAGAALGVAIGCLTCRLLS